MPLLDVANLTVIDSRAAPRRGYMEDAPRLVDGATFSVEAGETVAIAGEQGAGTLPLALALTGLMPCASGDVRFDGQSLAGLSDRRLRPIRKQMQVLFCDAFGALPPHQTIGRMLLGTRRFIGRASDRDTMRTEIERAMEQARLPLAARDFRPGDLDASVRQRAALARAMLFRPRLIICHDYTAGLDAPAQASLLNRLLDLCDETGFALLVMTHDLALADHLATRVHVMLRGRIVESGAPADLLERPGHEYTRRLIAAATRRGDGD